MSATVLVTAVLAAVLLARHGDWLPWLRLRVAVVGVGAAALLLVVGRLPRRLATAAAGLAIAACLAAPTAYTLATVATPHSGAIPSVGPARGLGGFGGLFGGGLLDSPEPGPGLTTMLAADADDYAWTAAVVGSNNAAGYQLASGAPGDGRRRLQRHRSRRRRSSEFQARRRRRQIHYFIRGGVGVRMASADTTPAAATRPPTSPTGSRRTSSR